MENRWDLVEARGGQLLVVILRVLHERQADLLQVALARTPARVLAGTGKDREQDRGKNSDDGDHYEEFYKGERLPGLG